MRIALLGDIAFFGRFSLTNNNNLKEYFKEVSEVLKNYDLVIGNLETPFVKSDKPFGYKSAHIKSDPINIKLLKYLSVHIVNLSNNHIYDFGKENYDYTKSILSKNNIEYFGIENKELIFKKNNNTISLNGYCCYSTNPLGIFKEKKRGINELHFPTVEKKLRVNSSKEMFNILSFHCGQEHVNYPNYDHIKMARKLTEIGPYVFYGHHPHVLQGIEKVKDSLLAYSLGNFCFDDVYTEKSNKPLIKQSDNNKESIILELEIEDNKLISHKVIPIYLGDKQMKVGNSQIQSKLSLYSDKLAATKEEYKQYREKLINNYIVSRKNMRNLKWYLKRLNYKSFFILKAARKNAIKYNNSLKKFL